MEADDLPGVEQLTAGQNLQGDAPAQRLLLCFIHHSHAAPADLAQDAEVTKPLQPGARGGEGRAGEATSQVVGAGPEVLDQPEHREEGAYLVGQLRVSSDVLGNRWLFTLSPTGQEVLGQCFNRNGV